MRDKDAVAILSITALVLIVLLAVPILFDHFTPKPAEGQLIPSPSSIRRLVDGTATAPVIAWSGATTTGFFRSGGSIIMTFSGVARHSFTDTTLVIDSIFRIGGVTFSSLGTPTNGTIQYCSDCTIAAVCAGLGTGAIAKRLNGVWVCN